MLARKMSVAPVDRSPAAVAATVPKPGLLRDVESRIEALLEERAGVMDAIRALIRENHDNLAREHLGPLMRDLDGRRKALEVEIDKLRRRIKDARAEHGAAVAEALDPLRIDTARRARAAAIELRDALLLIEEIDQQARAAGADVSSPLLGLGCGLLRLVVAEMGRIISPDAAQ